MKEYEERDPVVIEGGDGAYLIDSEGRRYIDGVSSLWVNIHGHRVPEIDNAIKEQVDKLEAKIEKLEAVITSPETLHHES